MKASLKLLIFGVLMLAPLSSAYAQGPSLSPIENVSVNVGATMSINVIAVDALNRPVSVTAALPPFATLNAPTLGTGVVVTNIALAPSASQVGTYSAAVTASAGGVSTVRVFQITVNAAGSNQAPFVTAPPLKQATAGVAFSFGVSVSDADGDAITSLTASGLPAGASFTPNASNTAGTFAWTPGASDAGEYDVEFTGANSLSGTSVTHIRVASAPTLMITPIANVTVAAGSFASVPVHASGASGAMITLTASLPTFATLNPPGSGTGSVTTTVTLSPPDGSAGTYHASVTATSEGASVTEPFDIIVTGSSGGGNHPPVVTAPAADTVAIGATLSFDISATDPDGDHVDLLGTALPPGSSFTDHTNETGTFSWTPASGQAGTYIASFTGTDGRGGSGSASTVIVVTGESSSNHAPVLSAPATEQVQAGAHLSFNVTASDPDNDHVVLSASSLPQGAGFSDNGDNSGTFTWTPGNSQTGSFQVSFLGYDGRGGTGTAGTSITVTAASDTGGGGGGGGGNGGGGVVAGRACLIGKFKPKHDETCFLIRPVHHSFDLKDVVLSSLRLTVHGDSIAALGAQIDLSCHDGHGHGDGDDDSDSRNAAIRLAGDHGDDNGQGDDDQGNEGDDCHVTCPKHDDDDHGHGHEGDRDDERGGCDTLGISACFSTQALSLLFSGATSGAPSCSPEKSHLPCALLDADIRATLKNGETVVATFGDKDDDDHDGKGDDDHKGKDGDDHKGDSGDRDRVITAQAQPNPLNPSTTLSFTTARDGRVRVDVYDMQGRLVKKLMDDFRSAGPQRLTWDGTNESSQRVASGVYFLRIQAPEGSDTRRVAVVK